MLKRNFNNRGARPLYIREMAGGYRKATDNEIIAIAMETINKTFSPGTKIESPSETKDFLKLQLGGLAHEIFGVLWLDNQHRVIAFEELFRGTIDGASIYPREIVKSALSYNAAACILAHNHPSGIDEPSHADKQITNKVKEALNLIDVRTLDHIIVGENTCSFAERGLL